MKVQASKTANLRPWQKDVFDQIDLYDDRRDSEMYQGMADFAVNKALSVTIAMPKGSGHTFLANYIANALPTLLVYHTMDHYKAITERFALHSNTETISLYEIFYALYKPGTHQPSLETTQIRKKFEGKKVVVIDNALSVPDDLKNFIYDSARGPVILLGH